ncbi:MAG: hypothetical protein H6510_04635 [Acidobacteria bacterium]|nr:hypothetical protein [Acidobacteriota bacterium]MCB9397083.1 hypothetical protein [Acidobacteriota bacterium]
MEDLKLTSLENATHAPELQELMRENMWLRKKLRRAEINLERTEDLKDRTNVLLRRVIEDLRLTQEELEHKNLDLESMNQSLKEGMERQRQLQLERDNFHAELVAFAHRTGVEEIATIVLHNVANALNSVSASLSSMEQVLLGSKTIGVQQVADLFAQHKEDLGTFLAEHEKGRKVPDFLARLAAFLTKEQQKLFSELYITKKSVDHISQIVDFQQTTQSPSKSQTEAVALRDLVGEAIDLVRGSMDRAKIPVRLERLQPVQVRADRKKVLQILLNLLFNAKQAIQAAENPLPEIVIQTGMSDAHHAFIQVEDNGVGIQTKHLAKLFVFGFTTKKEGHGYGLHGSANLAAQLGGKLTGGSDGPGCGAWFRLEIPLFEDRDE